MRAFAPSLLFAVLCSGCASSLEQTPVPEAQQVLAFPSAEGAGRFALGGRGGQVFNVTTLNDSGPGSLREAVDANGPRTVVFAVSGTIRLKTPLQINNGRLTIAGQTAPGDGITLRDQPLLIAADDVVVRYIRSRLGDVSDTQADAVTVTKGHRIIIDHVSASWSMDETLSLSSRYKTPSDGIFDATVQWSIISESLDKSHHIKGRHGYGTLARGAFGARFSFHHNLWAHHQARMPRPGNYRSVAEDSEGALFDFRNNVFYDWGGDPAANHSPDGPLAGTGRIDGLAAGYNADMDSVVGYNFINNFYKRGPSSRSRLALFEYDQNARAFFAGNSMDGRIVGDQHSLVAGHLTQHYWQSAPMDVAPVLTESASSAYARVLARAGASRVRDAVDRRILHQVRWGTGRIINSQNDAGGWPALRSRTPPKDADGDGLPDLWERKSGLNADDPRDGSIDADGDGYTALEDYLNSLAR